VDSVEIAIRKAGDRVRGAILSSEAFFPFPDSIQQAAAGIAAIIQPGGSKNDADVLAACNPATAASICSIISTWQKHQLNRRMT
jgi:phosphoribosylaminoimidazolecarboxamide formyltransferase/IMP cyclohydrolase